MYGDSARQPTAAQPARPLADARAWLITDGKAGMVVQAKGVADALGADFAMKTVAPSGLQQLTAPWGPVSGKERFGEAGTPFSPPWPDIAIATGRHSIPYVRALRSRAKLATYTVILQDPRTGPNSADLIWVPAHDGLRGGNVITTITAPHSFSQARLAELRRDVPAEIARLPRPRVMIALGGKNGVYRFTNEDDDRLQSAVASLGRLGASFVITPSRRSHKRLVDAVNAATAAAPRLMWNGGDDNPYARFLAHADIVVVTADSVNMTGEACATGRPVYVFEPSRGSAKFRRFHEALRGHGATRLLPDRLDALETWRYEPLDSAAGIAREIEARWLRRRVNLSGAG